MSRFGKASPTGSPRKGPAYCPTPSDDEMSMQQGVSLAKSGSLDELQVWFANNPQISLRDAHTAGVTEAAQSYNHTRIL